KLLLAGPAASMPGVADPLSPELQIPAEPVGLPSRGPQGAPAPGPPLPPPSPPGRVNFRKGEVAFPQDPPQVRGQIARLGLAAAILLVLGLGLGTARLSSLHRQAAAYDDAVCAATKRILGNCTTDYRQALGQLSGGRSRAAGIPRVSG